MDWGGVSNSITKLFQRSDLIQRRGLKQRGKRKGIPLPCMYNKTNVLNCQGGSLISDTPSTFPQVDYIRPPAAQAAQQPYTRGLFPYSKNS
jgi:hypothetical protein